MEKFRDRKFALLLYPEDSTHMDALEIVKKSYDCAYILHDKDKDENGFLKKAHYHVVLTSGTNQKWNTALAKELQLAENYIEVCRNVDRALEYLIHYNDSDKFEYPIEEVHGSMKTRLTSLLGASDKTEGEKVIELIEVIENADKIRMIDFAKHCATEGKWDVFRRSGGIFAQIIKEHNEELLILRNDEE